MNMKPVIADHCKAECHEYETATGGSLSGVTLIDNKTGDVAASPGSFKSNR